MCRRARLASGREGIPLGNAPRVVSSWKSAVWDDPQILLQGLGLRSGESRACGAHAGVENRSKVQMKMARCRQVRTAKKLWTSGVRYGKSKPSKLTPMVPVPPSGIVGSFIVMKSPARAGTEDRAKETAKHQIHQLRRMTVVPFELACCPPLSGAHRAAESGAASPPTDWQATDRLTLSHALQSSIQRRSCRVRPVRTRAPSHPRERPAPCFRPFDLVASIRSVNEAVPRHQRRRRAAPSPSARSR